MCLTKSSPMTEASRYTVRYFSRIPYIPSLNSKAALFIIRSLSWAPGDGGLPFSSLSSVKVSLWKRVKQNSISQEPEHSLYSSFHLRVERGLHALWFYINAFRDWLKKTLAPSSKPISSKANWGKLEWQPRKHFRCPGSATGDTLIMFWSNWSNFARCMECLYLFWLARTTTFSVSCLVRLFAFTSIMPYQHTRLCRVINWKPANPTRTVWSLAV